MTANARAWELRAKLFALLAEFKEFHMSCHTAEVPESELDRVVEAAGQADAVACKLASVYEEINSPSARYPLFTDAARDGKDQEYAIPLGGDDAP